MLRRCVINDVRSSDVHCSKKSLPFFVAFQVTRPSGPVSAVVVFFSLLSHLIFSQLRLSVQFECLSTVSLQFEHSFYSFSSASVQRPVTSVQILAPIHQVSKWKYEERIRR